MSFRLTTILWAFALLAAALATFGPWGIVAAIAVIAFWTLRFTFWEWCVVILIVGLLAGLLLPSVQSAREASRRNYCINNLKQLSLGLEKYADDHGSLPPAAGATYPNGPRRSWRLLLLPAVEHKSLHDAYRHDEAWNSPNNGVIGQTPMDVYCCPSDPAVNINQFHTSYFAVVGPRCAFLPERGRTWNEFKDARSQTILLIEMAGRETPWLKPEDLTFDEAVKLLTAPPDDAAVHFGIQNGGFSYQDNQGPVVNVVFADGGVGAISLPISKELATALLTIDGGETIDERELSRSIEPQLDYGKIYALATFVLLSLAPALARRRDKGATEAQPVV